MLCVPAPGCRSKLSGAPCLPPCGRGRFRRSAPSLRLLLQARRPLRAPGCRVAHRPRGSPVRIGCPARP
eukprot:11809117-Alexandrium_andersonii.AAC.1